MTNMNLKWRLGKLPSPQEVVDLVNAKIITQEEAKEILFKNETEEDRDKESLKTEIKFLRQVVDKLSSNSKIVQTIREVQVPTYTKYPWWNTYNTWCSSIPAVTSGSITSGTTALSLTGGSTTNNSFYSSEAELSTTGKNFSEIETF